MGTTISQQRSSYEAFLARAHRALWHAAEAAERLGDLGAREDVDAIAGEVSRLMSDSLSNKKRPRRELEIPSN